MNISQSFYDLIIGFEGLRLKAYLDSAGIPTIGIGTIKYPNSKPVKMGDTCTKDEAYQYLNNDLADAIRTVKRLAPNATQNQFDALVSFQYNTGHLAGSTLLKRINGAPGDIRAAFVMWNKAKVNGVLQVVNGLTIRRNKEADLYLSTLPSS